MTVRRSNGQLTEIREKLEKRLLWAILLGAAVGLGLFAVGDFRQTWRVLAEFDVRWIPVIVLLTCLNYVGRFFRWQYYLNSLGIVLPRRNSWLTFLSGLAMTITPGKAGELVKPYLVNKQTGQDFSRVAPVVITERLTDGMSMFGLMIWGLVKYKYGIPISVLGLGVMLIFILSIHSQRVFDWIYFFTKRLFLINKITNHLGKFHHSSKQLVRPKQLLVGVIIGLTAWSFEVLGFFVILVGLGAPASIVLLGTASFIFAFSAFLGFISFVPGGLGVDELSKAGLLVLLAGMAGSTASAATLLTRLFTLWFGVALGTAALLVLLRSLSIKQR